MVRGPMIAAVTAGFRMTNAIASWMSEQPGLLGHPCECVGGLELALVLGLRHVVAVGDHRRATRGLDLAVQAVATDSQPPASGLQGITPMPWRAAGGQHVRLHAAHEHRVRRLLAHEALAAAPLGRPLRLDDRARRERRASRRSGPCPARTRSESAPSVSSMSVSGSGRWIW